MLTHQVNSLSSVAALCFQPARPLLSPLLLHLDSECLWEKGVLVLHWFLKLFPFPHLFVALLFCRSMLLVGTGTGCKCYRSLLWCTSEVKLHTVIGKYVHTVYD